MSSGGIWWKQDWRYRIRIECEHLFMKRSRNPIWIALIIEIWLVKKIRLNSWKIQLNWKVNQINFLFFMTACFPWLTWVSMVEILNPTVLAFHWNFLLLSTAVDWLFYRTTTRPFQKRADAQPTQKMSMKVDVLAQNSIRTRCTDVALAADTKLHLLSWL